MSETFACPQCDKTYPHAGRKPGKAVVCVCGHRFLVPAPEVRAPQTEVPLHPPSSEPPSEPRRSSSRNPAAASPPATGSHRTYPTVAAPRPLPQQHELEAEVVYPGDSAGVPPTAELLTPAAYAVAPLPASHPAYEPVAAPVAAARHAPRSSTETSESFGLWVGRIVLFGAVPLATLCFVIGHLQMYRHGGLILNSGKGAPLIRRPAAAANGNLLSINAASMRTAGGSVEFHAQFAQNGFAPQSGQQYVWIISANQGTVEIPISSPMLTQQNVLTGTARGAVARRLRPPCTTWIESRPPAPLGRQRVSNEFRF